MTATWPLASYHGGARPRAAADRRWRWTLLLLLLLVASSAARPVRGAQVQPADSLRASADSVRGGVSPRGALIRSFLLPGWGQAAVGSMARAGVWFGIEGANVFMLVKTLKRLGDTTERERELVRVRADSLTSAMAMDTVLARRLASPAAFDSAVGADATIQETRGLIEARRQQRQDWITYTLFFTLLSGVDAYVNAHLRDFPVDISMRNTTDGTVVLRVDVPLGRREDHPPAIPAVPAHPPRRW